MSKDELLNTFLSNKRGEASFKVEGRGTNLRVWVDNLTFYSRIDVFKQSSVPLSIESASRYLDNRHAWVDEIANKFTFGKPISKDDVDVLVEILSKQTQRDVRPW